MSSKIQIRRDTATNWSSANPILASGEWGLDQTNSIVKIGNGSTAWNSLAGFGIGDTMLKSVYDTNNNGIVDNSQALEGQAGAFYLSRSNHSGTQAISTIVGLQTALDEKIPLLQKGANNGVATLGSDGKIPSNQLPSIALSETFVVASQAAMLALTAQIGDIAIRTDISKTFILTSDPASTLGNWQEVLVPAAPVQSVNGQTGNVVLDTSHVSENGNLYFTETRTRATLLSGYSVGTNATLASTDSILVAFGKVQAQLNAKEDSLPAGGTTSQYLRGDKSWQTLNKSAVGLGNVDNVQQIPLSYLDTDTTLGGGSSSNSKIPSQLAVKSYVDNRFLVIDGGAA